MGPVRREARPRRLPDPKLAFDSRAPV